MFTTYDDLAALFPHANPGYLRALAENTQILTEHGLDRPLPLCHFLAQCAHETGDFTIVEESGNYSAERLRAVFPKHFTSGQSRAYARKPQAVLSRAYASRMGNGPEASGDGWRYRGRSFFQTTGRDNYTVMSHKLSVDLVDNPDLLATDFKLGLKAALIEWSALDLGSVAERLGPTHEAVLAISRGINCGSVKSTIIPHGLADRKSLFLKIWRLFCTGASVDDVGIPALDPAVDGVLEEGERGEAVSALQESLAKIGYVVGAIDGIYGARTRDAVAAFQAREGLTGDGHTPGKWHDTDEYKLAYVRAQEHENPARAEITASDLRASGDQAVVATSWLKRAGAGALAFLGIDQAADQAGIQLPETFTALRAVVEPIVTNVTWLFSSRWVLWAVAAVGVIAAASRIERSIVARFRAFKMQP